MNLFGTDGIRTKVGTYPFTPEALPRLGRAIALWALEKYGPHMRILIAGDTRYSRTWVKSALATGLLQYPIYLFDAGMLSTPAVFQLMKLDPLDGEVLQRFSCGIIISASHNPAQDNGIKLVDGSIGKLSKEDEERITALFENPLESPDFMKLGEEVPFTRAQKLYTEKIIKLFKPGFLKGISIVLDCANGAAYPAAETIFHALGAHLIITQHKPNGYNINENCGALHPEGLQEDVVTWEAFAGFAFDGDGDRVVAVNSAGELKDGDDILAILLEHPDYKELPAVVSTVMANQGFEAHLNALGKKLIRTAVGDKNVNEALIRNRLTLGGEPSGHTILSSIIGTGDGIIVALKLLETMLLTNNRTMKSFKKFPQVIINVPIAKKRDLHEPPLSDIISAAEKKLHNGRLLVRYSGTEALVRVMVEDSDETRTRELAEALAAQLQDILS